MYFWGVAFVVFLIALAGEGCLVDQPAPMPIATATPIAIATPSITDIVNAVEPAIVRILTRRTEASGIIIRPDGIVLTAEHVVSDLGDLRDVIVFTSDGRQLEGAVICSNPEIDLAMVYVEAKGLPVVALGDPAYLARGYAVLKMGYALGLPGSVSVATGVVSAIRTDERSGSVLIKTDTPLNPGDSGGPLLDQTGQVVGINSGKWVGRGIEGLGFAVSINEARRTLLRDLADQVNCLIPAHNFPISIASGSTMRSDK